MTGLMIDTYGNYFCQKLIKASNSKQRIRILESVTNEIKFRFHQISIKFLRITQEHTLYSV